MHFFKNFRIVNKFTNIKIGRPVPQQAPPCASSSIALVTLSGNLKERYTMLYTMLYLKGQKFKIQNCINFHFCILEKQIQTRF